MSTEDEESDPDFVDLSASEPGSCSGDDHAAQFQSFYMATQDYRIISFLLEILISSLKSVAKLLKSHFFQKSINQSIYSCQYVGWGCSNHPSQRLVYETYHDIKNTKLHILIKKYYLLSGK